MSQSGLTAHDHSRDSAGLTYVYPVMSRRAGGLSIGINFNINNACNWRCIYCQVPDLKRGSAPELDFALLETELRGFLQDVLHGDFYQRLQVSPDQRVIKDIAISGNGEPTSVKQFARALRLIGDIARESALLPDINLVLITNGSLVLQAEVQYGLKVLSELGGEIWFKVDSATQEGRQLINNVSLSQERVLNALQVAASLCRTKLQTCVFDYRIAGSEAERNAYLDFLRQLKQLAPSINEILLYRIARPSMQPEAELLHPVADDIVQSWCAQIQDLGFNVSFY